MISIGNLHNLGLVSEFRTLIALAIMWKGFLTYFAVVLKCNKLCRAGMMWCVHLCQLGIFTGLGLKLTS